MKHAMDLNARWAMLKILKGGLTLSFAGLAAFSATACELVEPIFDDNIEQPYGDEQGGSDPQDWPDLSPECKKADEEYLRALSGKVPFPDKETYAKTLQDLYRNALATCGEGKIPLPPPIPGDLPAGDGGSGGSSCEDGAGGSEG